MPEPQASVSVVITAYQCARYLGEAIASVLNQSRPPQEVIVVDDGSTDDCAGVVRAFGRQVTYVYQVNQGIGPARNAGLRLATGGWLALLDGDDYWAPDKLAVQLEAVAAERNLDLVFAHIQVFTSPDLNAAERARLRVPNQPQPGYCASTVLVRREAFWRVGAFSAQYNLGEFIEWYGRASEAGLRERLVPDILVWRRQHANNTSSRNPARQNYARVLKAMLDRRRTSQTPDGS